MAKINNKFYTIKGSNGIEKLSLYTTLEEVNGKGKALKLPVVGKVYYAIGDVNDPNATKKRLKIDGKVYAGLREAITKKIYTKYYIFEPGKHDLYIPNNAKKVTYYMYGGGSGMIVTQDPILMNPNTGDITVSAADADWFDRSLYFANQWEHTDDNFEIFTNGQISTIVDEEGTRVAASKGGKLFVYRGISHEKYKVTYANSKSFDYTQYINTKLTPALQANNEYTLDTASLPIAVYNTKIREEFPKRNTGSSVTANMLAEVRTAISQGYRGIREKSPIGMENGYRIRIASRNSTDDPSTFNELIPAQYTVQDGNMPLVYNRFLNIIKLPTNLKKETMVYGKETSVQDYLSNSIRKALTHRTRCEIKYTPKYDDVTAPITSDISNALIDNEPKISQLAGDLKDYTPLCETYTKYSKLCRYYVTPDYINNMSDDQIAKDTQSKFFNRSKYNLAVHSEDFYNKAKGMLQASPKLRLKVSRLKQIGISNKPSLVASGSNSFTHLPPGPEYTYTNEPDDNDYLQGMMDIFFRSNLNMVDSEDMTTPHDTYTIPLESLSTTDTVNLSKYRTPDNGRELVVKSPFLRMNHTYYTNSVTELCNIDSNDTRNPDVFTNIYGTMNEPLCGCITGAKVQRTTGDIDLDKYKGKILTFNIGKGGTLFFNTSNKFVGYWRVDDIVDRFCLDNNGMAIVKMELEEFKSIDATSNNIIDVFTTPIKSNDKTAIGAAINSMYVKFIRREP